MKFRDDYGVYCCEHIFQNKRPVMLIVRDDENEFQFLCGDDDVENSNPHLVGIKHILQADDTLEEVVGNLAPFHLAYRESIGEIWLIEKLA